MKLELATKLNSKNAEYISDVFKALSTKERIIVLDMFDSSKLRLLDIAIKIGMSKFSFQNIIDDFRNIRLIEQTEHRSYYKLSKKGIEVLNFVKQIGATLEPTEKRYREEQLRQSISRFGSGLSKEELLKIVEKVGETNEKDDS